MKDLDPAADDKDLKAEPAPDDKQAPPPPDKCRRIWPAETKRVGTRKGRR